MIISRKYFGTQRYVPSIKRIKFSAPIRPDSKCRLELSFKRDKNTVTFKISDSANEEKTYSSGSFNVLVENQ